MSAHSLEHSQIAQALTNIEARQRSQAPDAAGAATGRLIIELREKFRLYHSDADSEADGIFDRHAELSEWHGGDVDDDLDESEFDWTERLRPDQALSDDDQVALAQEVEEGIIAEGRLTGKWRLPVRCSEWELRTLVDAGQRAFQRMLAGNYRLVLYWARRHARGDASLVDDLFQDGFFGLVRAIQGWDYRRGYTFSTYATWHIRQPMQRGAQHRSGAPVHLPVHVLEEIRSPGSRPEHLSANASLALKWLEGSISWEQVKIEVPELTSRLQPEFEEAIISRLAIRASARQVRAFLDHRSAMVVDMRSGSAETGAMTLDAIGQVLNLSRERVRQLENGAITSVRLRALSQSEELQSEVGAHLRCHAIEDRDDALRCITHRLFSPRNIAIGLKVHNVRAVRIANRLAATVVDCTVDLADLPQI